MSNQESHSALIQRANPVRFTEPHLNAFGQQCYCNQRSDPYNASCERSKATGSDHKSRNDRGKRRK